MKSLLFTVGILLSTLGLSANAGVITIPGNGTYSDSVTGDSGWFTDGATGDIDYWIFDITEPKSLSVSILSDIVFGISVYQGQPDSDTSVLFDNDADSFDLFNGPLTYVGGTDSLVSGIGGSLNQLLLSTPGTYTIAVGGNNGLFSFDTYQYDMQVALVPEPSILLVLVAGLIATATLRKRIRS